MCGCCSNRSTCTACVRGPTISKAVGITASTRFVNFVLFFTFFIRQKKFILR